MSEVAQSGIGGRLNERLSVAVGRFIALAFGYTLSLDADDPLCRELYLEFKDVGSRYPEWLAGRLTPTIGTPTQPRQLGLPGLGRRIPESMTHNPNVARPKVYIASALTRLSPTELSSIESQSEAAAASYSKYDYIVHQPAFHTHPARSLDLTDTEVHSIDYAHVANSDVLVLLGTFPSFGAGKELAWADTHQLTVVIVSPPEVRISRLVTGSPGYVLVPDTFVSVDRLRTILDQVAQRGLSRAKLHLESRLAREQRHLTAWLVLRDRVLSADTRCFSAYLELITPERIREIILSPTHFSAATVEELAAIERCLRRTSPDPRAMIAPDLDSLLSVDNLEWLSRAQEALSWSLEDCYVLVRLAEEQNRLQGVKRLRFSSVNDWAAFKRDSGV